MLVEKPPTVVLFKYNWFNSSFDGRYQSERLFGPRYARAIVPALEDVEFCVFIAVVFLRPEPIAVPCAVEPIKELVLPDHA